VNAPFPRPKLTPDVGPGLARLGGQADRAHLLFLERFRDMLLTRMFPAVGAAGEAAMQAAGLGPDAPLAQVKCVFAACPVVPAWQRFMRTQQEMMWRRVRAAAVADRARLLAQMDAAEAAAPERLVRADALAIPDYARREIHLQPGGYVDDPLGGVVYEWGTKVFYQGLNDHDEVQREVAAIAALPADGAVHRVLDLACGIGQGTLALKARFPGAEVTGLDIGLPLLRHAHARAMAAGVEVRFVHGLAEDMPFPDGHFDMIVAYILFHEVPLAVIPRILSEAHRVLRPGGTFSIVEFPSLGRGLPPAFRFMLDYDSRDNCEPYSPEFVAADFRGMLADAGFAVAEGEPTMNAFLQSLVATRAP
jgi:ubiquinone/menaquinone biosynthesis C-methylase UbiE